jgi:hypothetical protein
MPHGKRSKRINGRDLEVLEFIARYGVVPRDVVANWSRSGRSVSYARERRLFEAALIDTVRGPGEGQRLLMATAAGSRACGRPELGAARFSLGTLRHETVVARLGAQLESAGERILSEREIMARERAEGNRVLSAPLSSARFHRADLARVDLSGDALEAIEVELTAKGARRLDELLRAWRRVVGRGRIGRVTYRCPPHTRRLVEQAVERTKTQGVVSVEELWGDQASEKDETRR